MEYAQPMEYVQPVEYVEAAQSDDSVWTYAAAGALLVGAAAVYRGQQQERTGVAEPDLEAASDAMRVAMLFSSGRSSGKKAPARGKKAPAKRKAPARRRGQRRSLRPRGHQGFHR